MDDPIALIVQAARELPPEEQGIVIAREAMRLIRRADAAISDQALEAEFKAWWSSQGWPAAPGGHAIAVGVAWGAPPAVPRREVPVSTARLITWALLLVMAAALVLHGAGVASIALAAVLAAGAVVTSPPPP